jgi:hypothetical protein
MYEEIHYLPLDSDSRVIIYTYMGITIVDQEAKDVLA